MNTTRIDPLNPNDFRREDCINFIQLYDRLGSILHPYY